MKEQFRLIKAIIIRWERSMKDNQFLCLLLEHLLRVHPLLNHNNNHQLHQNKNPNEVDHRTRVSLAAAETKRNKWGLTLWKTRKKENYLHEFINSNFNQVYTIYSNARSKVNTLAFYLPISISGWFWPFGF